MIALQQAHRRFIEQAIRSAQAAGALPAFDLPDIDVQPPTRAELGDYGSAVALKLAKPAKMNPFHIAQQIANHLGSADFVAAVEVVHPGYINFRLNETWLRAQAETIIAEGDMLAARTTGTGKRAQVESLSANPSGPINVGRVRGGVLGDAVSRVLEAAGYTVEREYYFNNAGRQMRNVGNSMRLRYLEALGRPVEMPGDDDESFYRGDYLIDFAKRLVEEVGDTWADHDWQPFKEYAEARMFDWIRASLARVQIRHDVFFNENSLYDSGAVWEVLKRLEAAGHVYRAAVAEGETDEDAGGRGEAVWFRSTTFGDEKDRVLVKSSGEPTYTLPDIAYHINKFERGFDVLVNILGADHGAQYKVVQYGLTALGYDASKLHIIINQLVRTVRDGKEVRMSTRRGVYDTLDDLVDQTSADAVRFMLLGRTPDTHLNFDLDLAVRQSNENPVFYVQYAYVRCAGIFREAALRGVTDEGADVSRLGEAEMSFLRRAVELPDVIENAADKFEPHRLAFYALDLANGFHPIFDTVRVMHPDVPPELAAARLRFYRAAQTVFRRVLTLMGMTTPDVM